MSFKSNIWKMYAFRFLISMHFFSAVLIPFFLDYGNISFTKVMLLQSWFAFWSFILEIPTGTIADYFGRKTSLVLGALFTGLAALAYIIYPNIYIFLLAEFLFAMSLALMSGSDDALIYDSLKKIGKEHKSKKIFANISSYQVAAIAISAPIGSLIAGYFGVRWAMGAVVIPSVLALIIGLTLKEPKTKRKIESKRYLNIMIGGVKYLKAHKILKILTFDSISVTVMAFFVIWTYQLKLIELGIPIAFFGFVHAIIAGAQVAVMQNFSGLEKLLKSKKRYLLFSAIITGIFFIVLGLSKEPILAIISITIIAGFGLSRQRLFASYMNKYIESHNRATVISSIMMLKRFSRMIIYPIIALLVEWSLMYTFIILGAATIIITYFSKVEEEHLID